MAISPDMYPIIGVSDKAATTAFDNQALVRDAKKRAENYIAMSALNDKTSENLFEAKEDLDNSVMDASAAINRSDSFTGLGTALVRGLSGIDFGGGAQETVKSFGNQASGLPGNDFYVGSGGGIFPNPV